MNIKSIISSFDFYGSLFNFTINRERIFKTLLGGLISLITFCLIFYTSFLFGKDFFYRTNPKVLIQQIMPDNHKRIKVNNKNLTIAWRIEDTLRNSVNFDGKLFPILTYYSYSYNNTSNRSESNIKKIPSKKCKELNYYENINTEYNLFQFSEDWYCLDFDSDDFFLGGFWDSSFYDFFEISFNICNLTNENKTYIKYDLSE